MQDAEYNLGRIHLLRTRVNKGKEKGPDPDIELRLSVRAAYAESLPSYWTLNFQLLGWLPAVFRFWSRALPAKSCAPVVTVAL
jgi:hypothetical protein